MGHDGVEFGQFVAMGFDELQLVGRDVFFQEDGLILRRRSKTANALANFLGI